jgi:predicted acetyltransferase
MIKIEKPNIIYKDSFIKAIIEAKNTKEDNPSSSWYNELDVTYLENNFAEYIDDLLQQEFKENLPKNFSPNIKYFIINENNEYVGRISLRWDLTPFLQEYAGHIGYDILNSYRGKGYASKAMSLCLNKAKEKNLDKVLLTVYTDNIASKKIIEKYGGVFERTTQKPNETKTLLRYWITL